MTNVGSGGGVTKLSSVPKQTAEDEEDFDLGCGDATSPLIDEGLYEVGYLRASKPFKPFGGEARVLFYFQILTAGDHAGKKLFMALRVSPRQGRKSLAMSSKLVRAWSVAAGYTPKRTDRLSTKMFKGKAFLCKVETVKYGPRKVPIAPVGQYSIIRYLTERTAGG